MKLGPKMTEQMKTVRDSFLIKAGKGIKENFFSKNRLYLPSQWCNNQLYKITIIDLFKTFD